MSSGKQTTYEKKHSYHNGVFRALFAVFAITLEVVAIVILFTALNDYSEPLTLISRVLAVILVLSIYGQHKTASMKMPWIILICLFPITGVTMYLLIGQGGTTYPMRRRFETMKLMLAPILPDNSRELRMEQQQFPGIANVSYYLAHQGYPVYKNTDVIFYPEAVDAWKAQIEDLKKAESFIFMEYHAVEDAEAFAPIFTVLKEKAAAGVDVRLFYDDLGSLAFVNNKKFIKKMQNAGIQCRVFNPISPVANVFLNNRDHRKITVIDGKVGFTGGYNLANEYFGITHPYGHWKDSGVRIEGEAVRSLTTTFLEMWNGVKDTDKDDKDFSIFFPDYSVCPKRNGYVQPYADSPLDDEQVGENVYISLIESAKRYIYFVTPYLIITDEMIHALGLAAKRGVDVRIITPGIPDKKMVYSVTRSYYNALVRNGVRIYEYSPGFCHAKQCVVDDEFATCGTINLDYRSLYHHFENGCLIAGCDAVDQIKNDFDELFPQCEEVTMRYRTGRTRRLRLWQMFLRLFAELM